MGLGLLGVVDLSTGSPDRSVGPGGGGKHRYMAFQQVVQSSMVFLCWNRPYILEYIGILYGMPLSFVIEKTCHVLTCF